MAHSFQLHLLVNLLQIVGNRSMAKLLIVVPIFAGDNVRIGHYSPATQMAETNADRIMLALLCVCISGPGGWNE